VNRRVNEGLEIPAAASETAAAAPAALLAGSFHSVAHKTRGRAAILDVAGKRVLRLTDFATSNGPMSGCIWWQPRIPLTTKP
jgi:hypothetical protein